MITFAYRGVDARGRSRVGKRLAADESALEETLRADGVWLVSAREVPKERKQGMRGRSVGRRELIHFCALMEFLTRVGVPLVQSLELAAQDGERPEWIRLLLDLRQRLESGISLATAMECHPRVFRPDFTSLVRAGEASGSVPEAFGELKSHLEWQDQVMADVRQATLYPLAVLVTAALFVVVLFTFVVPKFVALLALVKVALPWPTRVVFVVSDLMRSAAVPGLVLLVLVGLGLGVLHRRSEGIALMWERLLFRLPVWGPLMRLLVAGRFARNLALLYRNGVALLPALKLVQDLMGSRIAAKSAADVGRRIEAGSCLSEALAMHDIFPPLLVRLVRVGERTGQLDATLERVAAYYLQLVPQRVRRLLGLLEPALILSLVGLVGFVALAVYLPILSLLQNLR
jgi:type II secretory pathway component PulF